MSARSKKKQINFKKSVLFFTEKLNHWRSNISNSNTGRSFFELSRISTGMMGIKFTGWIQPLCACAGRTVVIHADQDDLGQGGHELSKTTGAVQCAFLGNFCRVGNSLRTKFVWWFLCLFFFIFIIWIWKLNIFISFICSGNAGARSACGVIGIAK